jgi:isopenicillin-N N-acyltransferase-like protein
VTSGHSYLIGDRTTAESWEVTPTQKRCLGKLDGPGVLFHTNHCLDPETQAIEDVASLSKTTHDRFHHLSDKVYAVKNRHDLLAVLQSHDGFPKSICSHFESGAQDPSFTCGGGIMDLHAGDMLFWRGCEKMPELQSLIEARF